MNYNLNFNNIAQSYLFAEVANRVAAYSKAHPDKKVLKLGIGDVTLPLAPAVISALHSAVDDMSKSETFKGYGPYEGYDFLREGIQNYYKESGVNLELSEIFVSDGENRIWGISSIFSRRTTLCLSPTQFIPFTWIQT